VALIVMEPVRGGKLVNLPDEAKAILEKADPSITPARWALRFLQTLPHVQVVLSGMSSMEQLDDNIELFNDPMPLDEPRMEALQQAVRVMLDAVPCTACRYCTEVCPQGLDIPGLISMYNGAKHDGLGGIQFALGALKQDKLPTACIGCGACSGVCPQNIDVPDVLKKFSAML